MKKLLSVISFLIIISCNQQRNEVQQLQKRIDSLQKELAEVYRPGLGEFMSGIQLHHAKLWFAGQNKNWQLADFEVHEIDEALKDIQKFCGDRVEVKAIGMINPVMDSVNYAIRKKDPQLFKNSFILLTNACNNCHKETNHEFNVVTVPTDFQVVNQEFKPVH